jgi:choice-of-anchor B domain-containing protein
LAAYSFAQDQKNVILLDNWTDTTVLKGPEDIRYNDLWGFSYNGSNYAVIGSTVGAHFFQVHEDSLEFIEFEPGAFQNLIVQNRDYKTYQNYLYAVCDEGPSTLQIFDLSYLPDSVVEVYETNTLFQTSHNIFIDTAKAKLYACSPNSVGMKVFDLSDPVSPLLIYDFTDVPYVHDCFVRNDTAFLNCGFDGLRVYNFSGPMPILKGILDFYPGQGYNHSGRLNPSGTKYAFTDETEGTKIKLCDIEDLSQIQVNQTFGTSDYGSMIAHKVLLLEKLAFVSYYNEGLRIFDFSSSPIREIGIYDTHLPDSDFKMNGAWGVYIFPEQDQILISDRQEGLFLFRFPIRICESAAAGNIVTNVPFIDENRILISREHFYKDNLFFTITNAAGAVVYDQENYLNWVEIPLNLSSGAYVYGIFDEDMQRLEGGKFIIGN